MDNQNESYFPSFHKWYITFIQKTTRTKSSQNKVLTSVSGVNLGPIRYCQLTFTRYDFQADNPKSPTKDKLWLIGYKDFFYFNISSNCRQEEKMIIYRTKVSVILKKENWWPILLFDPASMSLSSNMTDCPKPAKLRRATVSALMMQ